MGGMMSISQAHLDRTLLRYSRNRCAVYRTVSRRTK